MPLSSQDFTMLGIALVIEFFILVFFAGPLIGSAIFGGAQIVYEYDAQSLWVGIVLQLVCLWLFAAIFTNAKKQVQAPSHSGR